MKQDADWKILATMGFLVATVAVPTVASLVAPPEAPISAASSAHHSDHQREPASTVSVPASTSHVIAFDVSCLKQMQIDIKAEGAFVQLTGKDCRKAGTKKSLAITNKTNGFTASIFELANGQYQTDLIQLTPGENQIVVQVQSSTGAFEDQVLKVQAN